MDGYPAMKSVSHMTVSDISFHITDFHQIVASQEGEYSITQLSCPVA